ncbi:MAG: hypothetical protein HY928_03510 [Elusimicrobia bacterium]|nr:hypothetical protein [Elusimicrobiota bacterium]
MKSAVILAATGLLAACRGTAQTRPDDRPVAELLKSVETGIRERNPDTTLEFFDPETSQGALELRRRVEDFLKANRVTQFEFWVDSVHRKDGLIWVKTHWKRVIHDSAGRPSQASGESDLILREGKRLRILEVRGSPIF